MTDNLDTTTPITTITPNFINQTSTLSECVGNTPLVKMQRLGTELNESSNLTDEQSDLSLNIQLFAKLEGNNPAGSVKDRPAFNMIYQAEQRGEIKKGDTLIEATSGNTGIALAMVAAMRGFKMLLIMPASATQERKDAMAAYGATLIESDNMEDARDLALKMAQEGKGVLLDQFNNADNKQAHYLTTGPELWQQTGGKITHFISSMGTTGTISGTAKYLKEQNPDIQIIGLQPTDGSSIAGIRRWGAEYMPGIFEADLVDRIIDIDQYDAEVYMRKLAKEEGIFCGVSSGGSAWAAHKVAQELKAEFDQTADKNSGAVNHSNISPVIAFIVCDRGDRYLSTGLHAVQD